MGKKFVKMGHLIIGIFLGLAIYHSLTWWIDRSSLVDWEMFGLFLFVAVLMWLYDVYYKGMKEQGLMP